MPITPRSPFAYLGGRLATGLVETVDLAQRPEALDRGGWWAVLATFEGAMTGYRFADVRVAPMPQADAPWSGPATEQWRSSVDRAGYLDGVRRIRRYIEAGDVYQVNLCRMLTAPLTGDADPLALAGLLAAGNPAPYQGVLHTGEQWLVTASPELFLARDGDQLTSSPIKGTTLPAEPFADKDFPENIMITDLVRNDLGRVGRPGSVQVTALLERQEHPGLAHLVSTVTTRLAAGAGWREILDATFPPGSVTGAPKIRALQVISTLEAVPRGAYCGAVGFVDSDAGTAELAVGIRTFFTTAAPGAPDGNRQAPGCNVSAPADRLLHFGTGAGITWSSDPEAEWAETELKAARLISLAGSGGAVAIPGGSTQDEPAGNGFTGNRSSAGGLARRASTASRSALAQHGPVRDGAG
jgi:para-aminobenzoate synthetase component 1